MSNIFEKMWDGLKQIIYEFRQPKEVREKAPEFIIENAVKGMIPHNKLAKERMARLKIFAGENHSHEAQKPEKVEVK